MDSGLLQLRILPAQRMELTAGHADSADRPKKATLFPGQATASAGKRPRLQPF